MTHRSVLFAGAILCLFSILAVPVAAVATETQTTVSGNNQIDPGLKDELWTIHTNHRLDRYDDNVETAREVVDAVDSYGYDTTAISNIMDDIRGKRETLADALEARDRQALNEVNRDLLDLWKDFRQNLRQLLKGN
jgi:hypothetical protein